MAPVGTRDSRERHTGSLKLLRSPQIWRNLLKTQALLSGSDSLSRFVEAQEDLICFPMGDTLTTVVGGW